MSQEIRTAFDTGFHNLDYSIAAFFKRQSLKLMNAIEKSSSERAAQNLVFQNRGKEARTLLRNCKKHIEARRRLIRQLK